MKYSNSECVMIVFRKLFVAQSFCTIGDERECEHGDHLKALLNGRKS
jgi:hypothetical protein